MKYLLIFSPNAEKYIPEITPYLDTFHAVKVLEEERSEIKETAQQELRDIGRVISELEVSRK